MDYTDGNILALNIAMPFPFFLFVDDKRAARKGINNFKAILFFECLNAPMINLIDTYNDKCDYTLEESIKNRSRLGKTCLLSSLRESPSHLKQFLNM